MSNAQLLTVQDVAEIFQISPHTVRRMANRGELPYIPLGPRLKRFRRSDIEELINQPAPAGNKNTSSPQ
jgi:excisionase family DNA binding protein